MLNSKQIATCLLSAMVGATMALVPVFAGERVDVASMAFTDMKTFDVDVFHGPMNAEDTPVRPEIGMFLAKELRKSDEFNFSANGDGRIHLSCWGVKCPRVRIEVTEGQHGPVVWKGSVASNNIPFAHYYPSQRKSHKVAKSIVRKIEEAQLAELKKQQRVVLKNTAPASTAKVQASNRIDVESNVHNVSNQATDK